MVTDFKAYEMAFARWWFRKMEDSGRRRLWLKLSKLIANGVPILTGLESMWKRRLAAHGKSDAQAMALGTWISGMNNGKRLSQVIDGWVGDVERMLIAAGENTGTIDKTLLSATRVMEARSEIKMSVIKGLIYPIVLLCLAFGVLYIFGFKVVPEFTKIVSGDRFTGAARFLVVLSDFTRNWIFVLAGTAIAAVVAFSLSLNRWDGRLRIRLDRYPPYSVFRMVVGSTWLIGLSSMLEAGVRVESAMQQLSDLSGKWLKARIQSAMLGMRSGLTMGDALHRSGYEFPDREIIDDLGVYSALAGFDEAIATIGREWLTESVTAIKARMAAISAIALVCVGLLIATMVGGMMDMEVQMSTLIKQRNR